MTHVLLILIYIAFISLGLPDALLGAAWPTIYPDFNVPVSYAGIIHSTPRHFGADRSQAVIGVQMASAYCGSCLAPPLFGALGKQFSMALFSWYMVLFLLLMVIMHERLEKMTVKQ